MTYTTVNLQKAEEMTINAVITIHKEKLVKEVKNDLENSLSNMFKMKPFQPQKFKLNVVIKD